jgi:4'-phosphopantetheinyl transferase
MPDHPQTTLTPQLWSWAAPPPARFWLAACPTDIPVIWQAQLTDDAATRSYLTSLLSAEERARLERLRMREDQQRFLVGRGVLRILLGAHFKMPPKNVQFQYGPAGKPCVLPLAGAGTVHFNVTHSGQLALLAFSTSHEVGVDVERVQPDLDWQAIAQRIFSADEYGRLAGMNPAEGVTAFFRAWTRHEAGLKALGLGFSEETNPTTDTRLTFFDLVLPAGYAGAAVLKK